MLLLSSKTAESQTLHMDASTDPISTVQYQNMELLFLLSGYQINLHVLPILSTLFLIAALVKIKEKFLDCPDL